MDPVTAVMVWKLLGPAIGKEAGELLAPAPPATAQEIKTLPDAAEMILHCYHRTGVFRSVDIVERPWSRGPQYNAGQSVLLRIDWAGRLGQPHQTLVGVVVRDQQMRMVLQRDSAEIPASPSCVLAHWNTIGAESGQPADQ